MKRSILLIALFGALLSSPVWAWGVMGMAGGSFGSAAGGCSGNIASAQGSTTITTGSGSSQTEMFYTKVTASATGYADTMTMRTQYGGAAEYLWMAVYDSSGDLLAEISPIGTSDGAANVSGSLDTQICVESGSVYYLGFQLVSTDFIYYFRGASTGNNVWKKTNTYASGPPATINPGSDGVEFANECLNIRMSHP